jgi:hypothetical protein
MSRAAGGFGFAAAGLVVVAVAVEAVAVAGDSHDQYSSMKAAGAVLTVEFEAGPNKLVEVGPNVDWPAAGRFSDENMTAPSSKNGRVLLLVERLGRDGRG